ncbi:hypothetical protein GF339_18780 [candidate division KSB3 bacterium]|uniref:Orc1-like AAA ATPase domain-containing protein n=1 Tax=candidate division KSB3 bacterium TaxID=2044937 RepID=A0A9D5JZH3_9BACT|nr:hypothetical protein [candidate division KSB3 bacterium]MBD3326636.1 hypothetical protein [candidate division KSB3 bacterium]
MKNLQSTRRKTLWYRLLVLSVLVLGGSHLHLDIAESSLPSSSLSDPQPEIGYQDTFPPAVESRGYQEAEEGAFLESLHYHGETWEKFVDRTSGTIQQVASVYDPSYRPSAVIQSQTSTPQETGPTPKFIIFIKQMQYFLIGGLLLTVSTLVIPSLVPRLRQKIRKRVSTSCDPRAAYQAPLLYSLDTASSDRKESQTASAQEMFFFRSTQTSPPPSAAPERFYYDSAMPLALDLDASPEGSQEMSAVRQFFQQSGFEIIGTPGTDLVLRASTPQYARHGEIHVFMPAESPLTEESVQDIYQKMTARYCHAVTGKLAFVIVREPIETTVYRQMHAYSSQAQLFLIPIHQALILQALHAATCAQTVERLISFTLGHQDLYACHAPIDDPLHFFERETVMHQLFDAVRHVQHISLFGLRKIGKTSLIWQLKERLQHHIAAYIDLQQFPHDCAYLYRTILDKCVHDVSKKYPEVTLPSLDLLSSEGTKNPRIAFMQDLVRLWEELRTQRHDIKIILLLDGAEYLFPTSAESGEGSASHEFIGTIRGISQQHQFLVSMLVSSSPTISRVDTWHGRHNPGFQYYQDIFVSSLSEEGCNQMITTIAARMGFAYTEESLSRIYYETAGHPYVTRQVCSIIAKNLQKDGAATGLPDSAPPPVLPEMPTVQVKDVEHAVAEYLEYRRDYLESIWQRLAPAEQEIVSTIALHDSCTLDQLIASDQDLTTKREQRKAISRLVENEIIEKCENKYSLKMGLLERFILISN